MKSTRHTFQTSDGVQLSWLQAGSGQTFLMLPGWSQSASLFRDQLEGLSDQFHCIALDYRGHGESEKINHGYRISRFAQDVHEFLNHLQLGQVTLLGHSMGASVIWAYLDAIGSDQLSGIVIDDQPAAMTLLDDSPQSEIENAGAIFPWIQLNETCNALKGPDSDRFTRNLMDNMLSDQISRADRDWIMAENFKFPRHHAASLLFNHSSQDWRDLIMRIQLPTLIIGGESSVVPPASQRWIHRQIPNSVLEIFPTDAGGHHFAFLENPDRFNILLRQFLMGLKAR
jgi:pimeloyl-ACP methyl ester carboxylesterase